MDSTHKSCATTTVTWPKELCTCLTVPKTTTDNNAAPLNQGASGKTEVLFYLLGNVRKFRNAVFHLHVRRLQNWSRKAVHGHAARNPELRLAKVSVKIIHLSKHEAQVCLGMSPEQLLKTYHPLSSWALEPYVAKEQRKMMIFSQQSPDPFSKTCQNVSCGSNLVGWGWPRRGRPSLAQTSRHCGGLHPSASVAPFAKKVFTKKRHAVDFPTPLGPMNAQTGCTDLLQQPRTLIPTRPTLRPIRSKKSTIQISMHA
eukprot:5218841-Amphidinium_carterae.1